MGSTQTLARGAITSTGYEDSNVNSAFHYKFEKIIFLITLEPSNSRERDRSGTRSENGFILGAGRCSSPSKENLEPDEWRFGGERGQRRRAARSCSAGRYRDNFADEATAKTYITIGPGKPTRIREHSPAKSAKLSSDENVTSARERSAQS